METPKIPKQIPIQVIKKPKVKEHKVMILPSLQTYMVQPNRVTFTLFDDFTMLQMKAFVAIMLNLQEAIKLDMNNGRFLERPESTIKDFRNTHIQFFLQLN